MYGIAISIMEGMGWTWDEYQDAPDDLIQELEIRYAKRGAVSWAASRKKRPKGRRGKR